MVFTGMITYDELVSSYQEIVSLHLDYVLLDGQNMMYRTETIFDDYVLGLVKQLLEQETFKKVIVMLSTESPLREPVAQIYASMGFAHKLQFVDDIEQGCSLILSLRNQQ